MQALVLFVLASTCTALVERISGRPEYTRDRKTSELVTFRITPDDTSVFPSHTESASFVPFGATDPVTLEFDIRVPYVEMVPVPEGYLPSRQMLSTVAAYQVDTFQSRVLNQQTETILANLDNATVTSLVTDDDLIFDTIATENGAGLAGERVQGRFSVQSTFRPPTNPMDPTPQEQSNALPPSRSKRRERRLLGDTSAAGQRRRAELEQKRERILKQDAVRRAYHAQTLASAWQHDSELHREHDIRAMQRGGLAVNGPDDVTSYTALRRFKELRNTFVSGSTTRHTHVQAGLTQEQMVACAAQVVGFCKIPAISPTCASTYTTDCGVGPVPACLYTLVAGTSGNIDAAAPKFAGCATLQTLTPDLCRAFFIDNCIPTCQSESGPLIFCPLVCQLQSNIYQYCNQDMLSNCTLGLSTDGSRAVMTCHPLKGLDGPIGPDGTVIPQAAAMCLSNFGNAATTENWCISAIRSQVLASTSRQALAGTTVEQVQQKQYAYNILSALQAQQTVMTDTLNLLITQEHLNKIDQGSFDSRQELIAQFSSALIAFDRAVNDSAKVVEDINEAVETTFTNLTNVIASFNQVLANFTITELTDLYRLRQQLLTAQELSSLAQFNQKTVVTLSQKASGVVQSLAFILQSVIQNEEARRVGIARTQQVIDAAAEQGLTVMATFPGAPPKIPPPERRYVNLGALTMWHVFSAVDDVNEYVNAQLIQSQFVPAPTLVLYNQSLVCNATQPAGTNLTIRVPDSNSTVLIPCISPNATQGFNPTVPYVRNSTYYQLMRQWALTHESEPNQDCMVHRTVWLWYCDAVWFGFDTSPRTSFPDLATFLQPQGCTLTDPNNLCHCYVVRTEQITTDQDIAIHVLTGEPSDLTNDNGDPTLLRTNFTAYGTAYVDDPRYINIEQEIITDPVTFDLRMTALCNVSIMNALDAIDTIAARLPLFDPVRFELAVIIRPFIAAGFTTASQGAGLVHTPDQGQYFLRFLVYGKYTGTVFESRDVAVREACRVNYVSAPQFLDQGNTVAYVIMNEFLQGIIESAVLFQTAAINVQGQFPSPMVMDTAPQRYDPSQLVEQPGAAPIAAKGSSYKVNNFYLILTGPDATPIYRFSDPLVVGPGVGLTRHANAESVDDRSNVLRTETFGLGTILDMAALTNFWVGYPKCHNDVCPVTVLNMVRNNATGTDDPSVVTRYVEWGSKDVDGDGVLDDASRQRYTFDVPLEAVSMSREWTSVSGPNRVTCFLDRLDLSNTGQLRSYEFLYDGNQTRRPVQGLSVYNAQRTGSYDPRRCTSGIQSYITSVKYVPPAVDHVNPFDYRCVAAQRRTARSTNCAWMDQCFWDWDVERGTVRCYPRNGWHVEVTYRFEGGTFLEPGVLPNVVTAGSQPRACQDVAIDFLQKELQLLTVRITRKDFSGAFLNSPNGLGAAPSLYTYRILVNPCDPATKTVGSDNPDDMVVAKDIANLAFWQTDSTTVSGCLGQTAVVQFFLTSLGDTDPQKGTCSRWTGRLQTVDIQQLRGEYRRYISVQKDAVAESIRNVGVEISLALADGYNTSVAMIRRLFNEERLQDSELYQIAIQGVIDNLKDIMDHANANLIQIRQNAARIRQQVQDLISSLPDPNDLAEATDDFLAQMDALERQIDLLVAEQALLLPSLMTWNEDMTDQLKALWTVNDYVRGAPAGYSWGNQQFYLAVLGVMDSANNPAGWVDHGAGWYPEPCESCFPWVTTCIDTCIAGPYVGASVLIYCLFFWTLLFVLMMIFPCHPVLYGWSFHYFLRFPPQKLCICGGDPFADDVEPEGVGLLQTQGVPVGVQPSPTNVLAPPLVQSASTSQPSAPTSQPSAPTSQPSVQPTQPMQPVPSAQSASPVQTVPTAPT